jgi:adenylate kinase/nucleoside 2-deoxyribosyltransferase
MRALVTGQVGMDKKAFLQKAVHLAGECGDRVDLYNVGDLMYHEAPDVKPGRILDLPLSRLNALRRAAFKDIISDSEGKENIIVNTHATFRWRHGLFGAFDFDQAQALELDTLICLVDNIETVHHRLHRDHTVEATFKDLMAWREEEILATELLARALGCGDRFYVLSRGRLTDNIETCRRLITRPAMRRVYPSFPMSHVSDMPDVRAEIDAFRTQLAKQFVAFDPGDVDEKLLLEKALEAAKEGKDFIEVSIKEGERQQSLQVSVKQVLDIAGDIDGQIYMRDFKLIDQADMIVSLVPELPGGHPALSSGVERELQHAFEHGKEVYVVWKPGKSPSPFITETATKVFKDTEQAMHYFEEQGMFAQTNLFGQ